MEADGYVPGEALTVTRLIAFTASIIMFSVAINGSSAIICFLNYL